MEYFLQEVDNLERAEALRVIRNTCRTYMTNNTNVISEEEQKEWFESLDRSQMIPFLFMENCHGVCVDSVGYGLIRSVEGFTVLTGGLIETERSKGLGAKLFLQLIDKARELFDQPIQLEVLNANERAKRLYYRLGFKPLYYTDRITYMELEE